MLQGYVGKEEFDVLCDCILIYFYCHTLNTSLIWIQRCSATLNIRSTRCVSAPSYNLQCTNLPSICQRCVANQNKKEKGAVRLESKQARQTRTNDFKQQQQQQRQTSKRIYRITGISRSPLPVKLPHRSVGLGAAPNVSHPTNNSLSCNEITSPF
jgi:hypothetical protein